MKEGKTKSGFKYSVNEDALASWEFVKACSMMLSANDTEKLAGTVMYVSAVLGDQEAKLVEHIKKKNDGKCSTQDMLLEISQIVENIKSLKN